MYFSGHGYLIGPHFEVWLLSQVGVNPNEAVNLPSSAILARNTGIPHIVFISDACRAVTKNYKGVQIQGAVIFPSSDSADAAEVDTFYATMPGSPAAEAKDFEDAESYQGIFTRCMLDALSGNVRSVIDNDGYIRSRKMKERLQQVVPEEASKVHISYIQKPDMRIESAPSCYLAKMKQNPTGVSVVPTEMLTTFIAAPSFGYLSPGISSRNFGLTLHGGDKPIRKLQEVPFPPNAFLVKTLRSAIKHFEGFVASPHTIEFKVVGATLKRAVVVGHGTCSFSTIEGEQYITVERVSGKGYPRTLLIQLNNGNGIPLAVIPYHKGIVSVESGRVDITYLKTGARSLKDVETISYAADSACNGRYTLNDALLETLVTRKSHPSSILFAEYAFARSGKRGQKSFSFLPKTRGKYVNNMFDLALLKGGALEKVTPFCPMLTEGWALLSEKNEVSSLVREGMRSLVPGLWTTFYPDYTDKLFTAIDIKELV